MTSASTDGEPPAWLDALVGAVCRNGHGETDSQDRVVFDELQVRRLHGGLNNPLYRFRLPDGRWCCLKLHLADNRQRARREWQALRVLSARGQPIVPRPLFYLPSDSRPAMVMEFLRGQPLGDRSVPPAALTALRTALQAVHAVTPEQTDEPLLEAETTAAGMVARMRRWWDSLSSERLLDGTHAALARAWRAWIAGPDPQLLCAPATVVLGRGDPNLGNCLWDGRRVALVDFEYAGWTDRAFELGNLVEHPQSRAVADATWERFVDGFDLCDRKRARYAAARRLVCFFWLARWWPITDQPGTTVRFTAQSARAEQLLTHLLR